MRTVIERLKKSREAAVRDAGDAKQRLRFFHYTNVTFSNVFWNQRKRALEVLAQFDQPSSLRNKTPNQRRRWWDETRQLQVDALVCLVTSAERTLFFVVSERHGNPKTIEKETTSTPATGGQLLDLSSNANRATLTLRLIDISDQVSLYMLATGAISSNAQQVLVELPGVLLPSFRPTLEALQHMSVKASIAFVPKLCPQLVALQRDKEAHWPRYGQQRGFSFDLQTILEDKMPLLLKRSEQFDFEALQRRSTLDKAQCAALIGALSREFALIQGPPGTGKSYVAVQLIKVLLAHRKQAKINAIIIM